MPDGMPMLNYELSSSKWQIEKSEREYPGRSHQNNFLRGRLIEKTFLAHIGQNFVHSMEKTIGDGEPKPLVFNILVFLEKVPKYLKEGPWSPVAHLVLIGFFGYILLTFEHASMSYKQLFDVHSIHGLPNREMPTWSKDWIQYYRFIGGCYGIAIISVVIYFSGVWPLASYTLTSWNLATIRLVTSFVGALNFSFSPFFQLLAGIRVIANTKYFATKVYLSTIFIFILLVPAQQIFFP